MHSKGRFHTVVAAFLIVLGACGGGGSPAAEISVPTVEFGPASNADGLLRATPNGFSFANFAASGVSDQQFDGPDLAAMFGSGPEVCATGSDATCTPTAEAAAWAQMINEARESGHCEGFIVLALDRFADKTTPETNTLQPTPDVVHGIFRGFAAQFMDQSRGEASAWRKKSVSDVVAELATSLKDGIPDYVLGVYGAIGGHAVLPYSVSFADDQHATIGIYDSNWPGQERHVKVDLTAQTWSFSFDAMNPENDPGAWTGGSGAMDLSSLGSHTSGPCPFCDGAVPSQSTMLSIRASSWTLSTPNGTVTPNGAVVKGVDVTKTRAVQKKSNEYVVTIEPSLLTKPVRLSLPKGARAHIVSPRAIARAITSAKPADFDLTESSITTSSRTATVYLANGNKDVTASKKATTLTLDDGGAPVNASSAGTGTGTATTVASTTTAPKKSATTVQAPSTTENVPTTVVTTTTAAPTTTIAPTTTVNQRPNVNATACTGSASTVTLTMTVSDPENDPITGPTFAKVSGPSIDTMNWASPSATNPYKWQGQVGGTYAPIVLNITVSDAGGSRTVTKTLSSSNNQWNGAGTCSVS